MNDIGLAASLTRGQQKLRNTTRLSALGVLAAVLAASPPASGQVLVNDPFVTGFGGWTDTFTGTPGAGAPPNWGVLLTGTQTLSESADGTTTDGVADGMYTPFLMVDTADTTPATYNMSATIGTHDNDGFGLVFGYQDNDNYFRVGMRAQTPGSVGFPDGVSVQKVVDGNITQLATTPTPLPIV